MSKRSASPDDAPTPSSKRARSEAYVAPEPESTPGPVLEGHGEDLDDDEDVAFSAPTRQTAPNVGYEQLYLDTINRKRLDFDFEKLCSVTLSNINVYACLVCGKYYQGRGPKTQAYFHALQDGHHVFINLETKKIYVLPEGYEVKTSVLDDIKYNVAPYYTRQEVARLDKGQKPRMDLEKRSYVPGFVGLNNMKANDYFNVVIQALSHVTLLRNYVMLEVQTDRDQLAKRFAALVGKIWNPKLFKMHVSPHELIQEVALRSKKRFTLTEQSDPAEFLIWFLNNLHISMGGSKTKPRSSIVQKIFQGGLKIESQVITAKPGAGDRLRFEDADVKSQISNFMLLTLDLPAAPLFQDSNKSNIIPQVSLLSLLNKYNGIQSQEKAKDRVRYRLQHPLPPCLIFHIIRFTKNKFISERNPTIVTFPRTIDMSDYVEPNPNLYPPAEPIYYDLVSNITHEAVRKRDDSVSGEQERKVWRVQVQDKGSDAWWNIEDLYVDKERSETLFTKESYIQVWERRKKANV
ncbi:cysteine proteinase [Amniculicola lignicola CBS 123094]|uniref:Cysteine proteinase n=1 Tax=Amniculicola lignicola CBS 123094 TaxID=1392246 RepID=A0A6A5WFS3_9PLEO|nr:cysteine proteinase [Amniculicola lignicola CBS 123094]